MYNLFNIYRQSCYKFCHFWLLTIYVAAGLIIDVCIFELYTDVKRFFIEKLYMFYAVYSHALIPHAKVKATVDFTPIKNEKACFLQNLYRFWTEKNSINLELSKKVTKLCRHSIPCLFCRMNWVAFLVNISFLAVWIFRDYGTVCKNRVLRGSHLANFAKMARAVHIIRKNVMQNGRF